MNVTCRSILNLPYMKQLKVVAGKEGMDNAISWVYYMEDIQYSEWLKGGELVIFTGLLTGDDEGKVLDLIDKLYEKNVAGIIINLSFYISQIPDAVKEHGDFLGLPIFEMPAVMRIGDVTQSICFAIYKEKMAHYDVSLTLQGVLSGGRITSQRIRKLESIGYNSNMSYRAYVIKNLNSDAKSVVSYYHDDNETEDTRFFELEQIIKSYMKLEDCLTTILEDEYIWMVPVDLEREIQEEARAFYDFLTTKSCSGKYQIGIGNVFHELKQFKGSVENAQEVLKLASNQQGDQEIYIYDSMILMRVFEKFENKEELVLIATQILKELLVEENEEL